MREQLRTAEDAKLNSDFPFPDRFFLHMVFEISTMILSVCAASGIGLALTVFLVRKALGY